MDGETAFEHKLRLCKAKINKTIDLDWQDIVDILDIDVHYDHLRKTAYGLVEYDNYLKNKDGVATRILSISDTHVPFHLPIETFDSYVGLADVLQLNGDILDCQSISKFPKTYRVSMIEEMIVGRQYIIDLIKYISPKKVVITYGNHELRFQSYLSKNLDNDMIELMPQTALDLICTDGFYHYDKRNGCKAWYEPITNVFKDIDVTYVGDWKCKIGKAWFAHPSAYSSAPLKTCEKAMDYFHRTDKEPFDTVVLGHTHKTGERKTGYISLFEQGACCYTGKINYTDGRLTDPQKEGFAYICQNENGDLIESKSKVVKLN